MSNVLNLLVETIKTGRSQRYYNNFWEKRCQVESKQLSSSGLGDNVLKYISMDGRVVFDIQKEIQKGHALESYKLDDVSAHFMKGSILNVKLLTREDKTILGVKNIGNLKDGDYITININTKFGSFKHNNGKKYKVSVVNHELKILFIEGGKHRINKINKKYADSLISYEWCLAKDDISPQQIFDKHKYGGSKGVQK